MYYTLAETGIIDRIGLAESDNGLDWEDRGVVFGPGEAESWDSLLVGRGQFALVSQLGVMEDPVNSLH